MSMILEVILQDDIELITSSEAPQIVEIHFEELIIAEGGGAVSSVNGKTGDVVINKTDVGLGNVPNIDTTAAVNNSHAHSNKTALDNVSGTNTGDQDLSGLQPKEAGKGLSTNDYTDAEKAKLNKALKLAKAGL